MKYLLIEAFSAAVILTPVFLVLHKIRFHYPGKSLLCTLFALYLAAVYHLTGLPTVLFVTFDVNLNLIPFGEFRKELVLSILNVAMFVPLGFFLPLLWEKYRRFRSTLLFGFGATVTIELLQMLTYRATDINDVITNSLGAILGFLLFGLSKNVPQNVKPGMTTKDLWLILMIVAAVMFFLQPLLASLIYKIT